MKLFRYLLTLYLLLLASPAAAHASRAFRECDSSLWRSIYHPARLVILDSCITVTGTIMKIKKEKDGDIHISLKLDSQYTALLSPGNITKQHSCLVVEIIPAHPTKVPVKGSHVAVTGAYVLDKHHGWNEIHPVSAIDIIY